MWERMPEATVSKIETVQNESEHKIRRTTEFYSRDATVAAGKEQWMITSKKPAI